MIKLDRKYTELLLYGIFGVLTTAVNYGSYAALAHMAGLSVAPSNGIAWALSVLFAFITNKLLVFGSKSLRPGRVLRELGSFVACRLASGGIDMGVMMFCTAVLHANDLIVKLGSNIVVILLNYILSKAFVFSRKERAENG